MSEKSRIYPDFPIPAVGAVILNGEHILLVQRGQAPAKGKWTLPGGVIELGESPEEALNREVLEECGLLITIVRVIDIVNKVIRDARNTIAYHYVILDYLAHCQTEGSWHQVSLQPETDVMDVQWIPLSRVNQYDITDGLLEIINAGVAMENNLFKR